MLRKRPGGPVTVSALVRTTDPRRPEQPPTMFLNPLPGDQYAAASARRAHQCAAALQLPARVLDRCRGFADPDRLDRHSGGRGTA